MVETWLEDDESFYETGGSKLVYDKAKECSCILVTSSSGSGKTAVIRHTAFKFKLDGFSIVPIESPGDIFKYKTNKKQVFIIDDVLGKYYLNPLLLEEWERINEKLISCLGTDKGSTKILCTLRLQIAIQNKFKISSTILNKVVINLEHDLYALSKEAKPKVLFKHLSRRNLEKKIVTKEVEMMCDTNYAFPLLCKLISNDEERFKNRIAFFRRPLSLLNRELDKICTENKKLYCILVLCMLLKGSISKRIFDTDYDQYDKKIYRIMQTCRLQRNMSKKELEDCALSAIGSYFIADNSSFWFIHDFLEETIGCHFYSFDPSVMLSDCDILFIRDQIKILPNENTNENINDNVVIIRENELNEDRLKPLYDRLWNELNNGRFSAFLNSHLFKNRHFVCIFGITFDKNTYALLNKKCSEMGETTNLPFLQKALKILTIDRFQDREDIFMPMIKDSVRQGTLIRYIVAYGCYEFFRYAWRKLTAFERKNILYSTFEFVSIYNSFVKQAVSGGSLNIVEELISYGTDVNAFSEFDEKPINLAVKVARYDIVRLLLRNGAQVILRELFQCMQKIPFDIAENRHKMISLILEYDLDKTELHEAVCNNDLEKLRSNIRLDNIDAKTKSGLTVLHYAVLCQNSEAVMVLFDDKLDDNFDSDWNNSQDIHRQLLSRKPTPKVNIGDNNGITAVHLAVIQNDIDILSLLLRNKANIKVRDDFYRTPLHYTTSKSAIKLLYSHNSHTKRQPYEKREYTKALLSTLKTTCFNITLQTAFRDVFRDFVNLPDKEGNTPIHSVIMRSLSTEESSDCIETLLQHGANPYLLNDRCISPIELIDRYCNTDKYINTSAKHSQSIQNTHKVFLLVAFILIAVTYSLLRSFISVVGKESTNEFNCVGQVAESGNVSLVQVTRSIYVLLTSVLFWLLSLISFNKSHSVLLQRCVLMMVSVGCVSLLLFGSIAYCQTINTFEYINLIISIVVACRVTVELILHLAHILTYMHLKHMKSFQLALILILFCLSTSIIVIYCVTRPAEDKHYHFNFSTMRVMHTLNITALNCTELTSVNIACTSLVYNITYKNGINFLVQCRQDPNITSFNGTLTVESELTDWSEIGLVSLFWSHAICAYCFILCFSIFVKRSSFLCIFTIIPYLDGFALCFYLYLVTYMHLVF